MTNPTTASPTEAKSNSFVAIPESISSESTSRKRIAFITSVPSFVKILTGEDAYKLSSVSVTRLQMDDFLLDANVEGIDAVLFFAPAITGSWTQFDVGDLAQMRDKMLSAGKFDEVINLCQLIPLYRRSRIYEDTNIDKRVDHVMKFVETLVALASLTQALRGTFFEPRTISARVNYAFDTTMEGTTQIASMERDTAEWLTDDSEFFGPALNIGQNIGDLPVPEGIYANRQSASDGGDTPYANHTESPDSFAKWLDQLGMGTLLNRYIYSHYQNDFDRDAVKLTKHDRKAAKHERFLSDVEDLKPIAAKVAGDRFLKDTGCEQSESELLDALSSNEELAMQYDALAKVMGDDKSLSMLNITYLMRKDLPESNVTPAERSLVQKFIKKMRETAAFQELWDRQASVHDEDALNKLVNGLYVVNSLMEARSVLEKSGSHGLGKFNFIAFPIMPTNSVRFVLSPDEQEKSTRIALIHMLEKLAPQTLYT